MLLPFNHLHLSSLLQKKKSAQRKGLLASGWSKFVCRWGKYRGGGHHLRILKCSRETVYVYVNIFRQAAAGGARSKTLVCIVCVSAPLAPCRVITWGNLLPNQHWHTQRQSTLPPPPHLSPPFLSLSSGASQLILHHFIFPLLLKWQMADCYFWTLSIHAFWHCNWLNAIISLSCPNTEKIGYCLHANVCFNK